ncbi:MAG TPA: addiction module protein [Chitinophagaceae bacterium]|nr:addiction module protein [Chitinophagaceae bacterium]
MPYNKEILLNLSVDEKLELVDALWESIDTELLMGKNLSKEIKAELDKRIKNLNKYPEKLISWEDVKGKMRSRE